MVAFLFSDVEGSTERWEQHPQAMSDAIRRHDSLLHDAVAAHGGAIFKTLGDGICAAFAEPGAALAAAVAAQRELRAQDWSAVRGLRVRMALHAGNAEHRGGDYFGPAVNRVARVLSAGHGGQILATGAFADAVRTGMPETLDVRPLGLYRLKDLQEPERIYQVIAPELPAAFRALRTLEAVPNNLPVQSTPLVGRRSEVAAVSSLLRESALVTIAGAGGVGKTRVALQSAANAVDRFEHGVWFAGLAPLGDPGLIAPTLLSVLGAPAAERGGETAALLEYLRGREALLVLDNCEHLVAGVADLAAQILARCPRVAILATSRELLHAGGERVFRLEPLDAADAAELFAQRANAVAPFDAASQARGVQAICERLDGIPLAIELAAARTRALSVSEIASRLDERFTLLAGGVRGAMPRQQTLRALIDWSYDLLSPAERALLRALSAVRGSFSIEAAAALSGEDADEYQVLDLLTSLNDKSLISAHFEETTRYRMLESIRGYAAEKSAAHAEETPPAQRHAAYFGRLASRAYREFDTRMPPDWLRRLRPELDNLRAALSWMLDGGGDRRAGAQLAADCGPAFMRLELLGEGLHWCERARRVESVPAAAAAQIEYVSSMLHNNLGAYREALQCAERAVALYRSAANERGLVRALSQTAQQYARAHRFAEAQPPADEAIRRARALGEPRVLIAVLRRCAFALPPAEIDDARALFGEALRTARAAGEAEEACLVLEWWAEREAAARCFERAMQLAGEGLECAAPDSRMYLESNITGYALAAGRLADAAPHAREALKLALEAEHPVAAAIAIAYCAPLHARTDPQRAALLYGYARAQMRALEWDAGDGADRAALENAERFIRDCLEESEFAALADRASSMPHEKALTLLDEAISSAPVPEGAAPAPSPCPDTVA